MSRRPHPGRHARERAALHKNLSAILALLAGLDGGAEWSAVRPALSRALQEATPRPAVDGGTLATYLTRLTDEQWLTVQRGRAQLAEARDLRAKAAALEADGTRILEGLLDTPAGAQAPAPVAPEPPVELVPPPPPPSGEQPATGGTMADRALEFFEAHPTKGLRAQQLADALGGDRQSWTVPLSQLTTRGEIERVERGLYRLARKGSRRAA